MDKKRGIIILGIFAFLFLANFISAMDLYDGIILVKDNVVKIGAPILSFLLGGDVAEGALFTKLLIFVIIIILAWIGAEKGGFLNEYPKTKKILIAIVAILAIQGINRGLVDTIILPYTILGVSISAGLPFLIYFFIINKGIGETSETVRRTAWIFFGVIFFGLLLSKIGGWINLFDSSKWGYYWIYFITAILAFIMAILDGTIKNFFLKVEADKLKNINKAKILSEIIAKRGEYKKIEEDYPEEYKLLMDRLRKELRSAGIKRKI